MAVKGVTNNPAGGPVKVEIDDKKIIEIARLYGMGLTQEMVADRVGVSLATLKRYMTKHPDLKTSMFMEQAKLKEALAKTIWKRALDKNCPPAIQLFMARQFLWDKPEEINVTVGSSDLIVESMKVVGSSEDDDIIEAEQDGAEREHVEDDPA